MKPGRLKRFQRLLEVFGASDALRYIKDSSLLPFGRTEYHLTPRILSGSLVLRSGESDKHVLGQIFVDEEYLPLVSRIPSPGVIVDCGANVGFSTAWFAASFPSSRIVAVEADDRNVVQLRRNVAQFGERVSVVHAGIWTDDRGLKLERGKYRGGGAWTTQVRECRQGECPDIESVSILQLMRRYRLTSIDVLKMDIEGAEVPVLAESRAWMQAIAAIVIELHDDSCFGTATGIFEEVMQHQQFDVFQHGELSIGIRRNAAAAVL
jgi:FkbM family methyltransferase